MKSIIHVNKHKIRSNQKHGTNEPVLTVKSGGKNRYGQEVRILDAAGVEIAKVVYRPRKPLSCGATVWIESKATVVIDQEQFPETGEQCDRH